MKIQSIAALALTFTVACGAAPTDSESTGATSEAVTSTGTAAGAYKGNAGAEFADIVLDANADAAGHYDYFLEEPQELITCKLGSGCVTTHVREDGYYSATATHLTLHPSNGPERVYSYTHKGSTLSLERSGSTSTFTAVVSYCDAAVDCPGQGLIRSYCDSPTAGWECNANLCSWACSGAE